MDARGEPCRPCSCFGTHTLSEGGAIGQLSYNIVAPGSDEYIPEPDGPGVSEPGTVYIPSILKQPSCKDAPVGRHWVGGIVISLPSVKKLDPLDFPGLASASDTRQRGR